MAYPESFFAENQVGHYYLLPCHLLLKCILCTQLIELCWDS